MIEILFYSETSVSCVGRSKILSCISTLFDNRKTYAVFRSLEAHLFDTQTPRKSWFINSISQFQFFATYLFKDIYIYIYIYKILKREEERGRDEPGMAGKSSFAQCLRANLIFILRC